MRTFTLAFLLAATVLAGCVGDDDAGTDTDAAALAATGLEYPTYLELAGMRDALSGIWQAPEYRALPETLSAIEHVTHVEGVSGGNGIAVFGGLAFVGPTQGPLHIVDISDPAAPTVLSVSDDIPARDVDTIAYPDGRLIIITTGGSTQMYVSDVTDPADPVVLSQFETPHTNHNIAVVPGTHYVYNSPSGGEFTDIFDLSDPENPVKVQEWQNGFGCHDVSFYASEDKHRGYCAGLDEVQIWDTTDPANPEVVQSIKWPAGGIEGTGAVSIVTFAHLAMVNDDATVLILGDETGGGAAPGCDVYADTPLGTVSGPLGNLWFYDLADETAPVLKGHVSPMATDNAGTCTAHFGHVIEDTDHVAMSFYSHGVVLVDFTDLQNPVIKDTMQLGNVWDTWYYQGYLFTGDISGGMDVLTLA